MERDRILATLRRHEAELKAAGILHLRLFGSAARGEETSRSDKDLLADLDGSKQIGLLAVVHVQNELTDLLGQKVHLSLSNSLRPVMLDRITREAVPAF